MVVSNGDDNQMLRFALNCFFKGMQYKRKALLYKTLYRWQRAIR